MQITITRQELLELWNGLPALANLKGFKLGYAVARTKAKLKVEVEAFEEALKPAKDFEDYEKRRMELCQKHSLKDMQGAPMVSEGQFMFGTNREAFDEDMGPLTVEYAQAIEDRKAQLEGYQDSLRESIEVEVHQIGPEDVPEDATVAQVEVLYRLIKAEE